MARRRGWRAALRRLLLRAAAIVFAGLAALAGLDLGRRGAGSVEGRPAVVDGDTLRFGERVVRIEGVDACEIGQEATDAAGRAYDCGAAAREALADLIGGGVATCGWDERDRWGRRLGRCRTAGAGDLGAAMVRAGQARAYWRGGEPVEPGYVALEAAARLAGRGVWAGDVSDPRDWRRRRAEAPFWERLF